MEFKPKQSNHTRGSHDQMGIKSLVLTHGSLLIMAGTTQRHWLHSIPRLLPTDEAQGVRINLTFRVLLDGADAGRSNSDVTGPRSTIADSHQGEAGALPVSCPAGTSPGRSTRGGRPHTLFFDKNTGLLIGDRVPDQGPDGKMRLMTVRIENYREFGGVLYPTRFVQTFSDNARPNTMNFNEIEVNADDEHDYTVPDSVRERFDSAKKAEQEAAGAQGDG
mgnify:CR=1 FL=1